MLTLIFRVNQKFFYNCFFNHQVQLLINIIFIYFIVIQYHYEGFIGVNFHHFRVSI
jgi:hypothetical protein